MKNKQVFYVLISGSITLFSLGWFFLAKAFYLNNYIGLFLPFFFFLLAFALFYFLLIFENKLRTIYLVYSFGMFGIVFLGGDYFIVSFLIWLVASFFCTLAIKRVKTEQQDRIKINIYQILKKGVPIMGTIFCFLVASGFYFSVIRLQKNDNVPSFEITLPFETTKLAFVVMNAIVPNEEISWIAEGVTVDEYFQRILRSKGFSLEGVVLEEIKNETDQGLKKQMEASVEREVWEKERRIIESNREMLQEKLGIELEGRERVDNVLHSLINKRLNEFINKDILSSNVLPIGGTFALFITISSIMWFSNLVLFWTVSLIFSILVKLGKIKIEKKEKEIEVIAV